MLLISDSYNTLNEWVANTLREDCANWNDVVSGIPEIEKYIDDLEGYFNLHQPEISARVAFCKSLWHKFEQNFEVSMSHLFQTDVVLDSKAYITFFPLYPRDIEQRIFLIPFVSPDANTVSIIVHEQIHFYYYDMLSRNGLWNNCQQKVPEDVIGINKSNVWLIGEIVIPLIFEYLEKHYSFSGLKCSGYCFTDLQKLKVREFFNKHFICGEFMQFILLSNETLQEGNL